jgi:hypothetical protein
MNAPGQIISLIAGAAGGLLCGWLIFGQPQGQHSASPSAVPGTASAAPPDAPTPKPDRGTWAQRHPAVSTPSSTSEPHGGPHAESAGRGDELQQLRERVVQLEKKLAAETKFTAMKEGSPIKPPEHLDARFESERIRLALNAAIKAAGLDGEVNAIDCGEYPCMAIGEMKGSAFGPDESTKVADALTKAGYAGDSKQGFGARIEENGQARNLFGVAIFPKPTDDDELQQLGKRLRYRFNESQGLE